MIAARLRQISPIVSRRQKVKAHWAWNVRKPTLRFPHSWDSSTWNAVHAFGAITRSGGQFRKRRLRKPYRPGIY
jgi:hypothetical protein